MPHYWVFRDQSTKYKGWFVDLIPKQLHAILADFGYANHEYVSWVVPIRNAEGKIIGKNVGARWKAVRELEYKYAESVFDIKYTVNWFDKPRPGVDPKSGATAVAGDVTIRFHAWIKTDNKFIWQKSPILKYLLPIREKYFYLGRIEKFRGMIRNDYENIVLALKKYFSYLPAVA